MSRTERKAKVVRDHPGLSLSRQCLLLSIGRSSFYYALSSKTMNEGEGLGAALRYAEAEAWNALVPIRDLAAPRRLERTHTQFCQIGFRHS